MFFGEKLSSEVLRNLNWKHAGSIVAEIKRENWKSFAEKLIAFRENWVVIEGETCFGARKDVIRNHKSLVVELILSADRQPWSYRPAIDWRKSPFLFARRENGNWICVNHLTFGWRLSADFPLYIGDELWPLPRWWWVLVSAGAREKKEIEIIINRLFWNGD